MGSPRPTWWPIAAAQGVVALVAVIGLIATRPAPPPEATPLDEASLERAAEVLRARRVQLTRAAPLDEAARAAVMSFVGLQIDAADLELAGLRWGATRVVGPAQVTPLDLEVTGDALNLPVLVDGLYRQSHPVLLTALALVHRGGHQTRAILKLRIYAPTPAPSWTATPREGAADRAVAEAAKEAHAAAFAALGDALDAEVSRNRRAVMRALPRLIRGLPQARRGWLGLAVEDGVLVPLAGERPI